MTAEPKVVYLEMTQPQAHSRFGKLPAGKVIAVDEKMATRFVAAGVAEESSKAAYDRQRKSRQEDVDDREAAFARLNAANAHLWDTSTHRDALTAPEEGLRRATEAGVPLVNVDALRDEEGMPLPADASIEDIMAARSNLHPDELAPLTAHARSSVSGGGSHYDMPMPLNPRARAIEDEVRAQERSADTRARMALGRDSTRTMQERRTGRVSDRGRAAAREAGVREPRPASGDQVGNAPEKEKKD